MKSTVEYKERRTGNELKNKKQRRMEENLQEKCSLLNSVIYKGWQHFKWLKDDRKTYDECTLYD